MDDGLAFARLDRSSPERFVALRRELGVTTFGLNQMLLRPGQSGRIHRQAGQEEVYLVLEGALTLIVEREEHALGPGELVRVAPSLRRQLVNRGPQTLVLLALGGAAPHEGRDGEAFESWEDEAGRPPQEIPLPEDLQGTSLRTDVL